MGGWGLVLSHGQADVDEAAATPWGPPLLSTARPLLALRPPVLRRFSCHFLGLPTPRLSREAFSTSPSHVVRLPPARAHRSQPASQPAMCLVKVRQEEDVVVPYRVVQRDRSPRRRESVRRVSRTEIVRESPRPSSSYLAVPAPRPMPIPAPQPVPVFYEPAPQPLPPPPPSVSHRSAHHAAHHVVEVSPRSSVSSASLGRSDYVLRERDYRLREHSPASSSPRYEHFRYVDPAPSDSDYHDRYDRRRSRSRVRERSLSRGRGDHYGSGSHHDYGERVTRERITISERDRDGRRSEYRR